MTLKFYKPYTPGIRARVSVKFSNLSKQDPIKRLTSGYLRSKGRNFSGKITARHKGGGHKRLFRLIDFKRSKRGASGKVVRIEYDPNRTARIALILYSDGDMRYILHPYNLDINQEVLSSRNANLSVGNSAPLINIPSGTEVHNIEINFRKGGQLVRAAGTFAKIIAKDKKYVTLKLPSKELRLIPSGFYATIGKVGNSDKIRSNLAKAGRNRWLGIRPSVRGSAMNPVDHPHGGGEGKSPIGKSGPRSPWGKPTLGFKTKDKKKDLFIKHK